MGGESLASRLGHALPPGKDSECPTVLIYSFYRFWSYVGGTDGIILFFKNLRGNKAVTG